MKKTTPCPEQSLQNLNFSFFKTYCISLYKAHVKHSCLQTRNSKRQQNVKRQFADNLYISTYYATYTDSRNKPSSLEIESLWGRHRRLKETLRTNSRDSFEAVDECRAIGSESEKQTPQSSEAQPHGAAAALLTVCSLCARSVLYKHHVEHEANQTTP